MIDIETTGFLPSGKIVEVGIVELCLCCGSSKIIYDKVFNPEIETELLEKSWIVTQGYMSVSEILKGAKLQESLHEIQSVIDQYAEGATAYNRNFDISFLTSVGVKFGKLLPCPMLRSTDICKLPGKRGGYKWPKVEEAYKHFFHSEDYVELHRGADDAIHEAKIVYELHKKNKFL